jgi:hypothetical protein
VALRRVTAIEEALRMETYATPMGHALLEVPEFLRFSTHTVWWLESAGAVPALHPVAQRIFRFSAVALLHGFSSWRSFLPADRPVSAHRALAPGFPSCPPRLGIAFGLGSGCPHRWNALRLGDGRWRPAAFCSSCSRWNIVRVLQAASPRVVRRAGFRVGLDQKWQLFAPSAAERRLARGGARVQQTAVEYDAFTGQGGRLGSASFARDARVPSVNWRKFLHRDPRGPSLSQPVPFANGWSGNGPRPTPVFRCSASGCIISGNGLPNGKSLPPTSWSMRSLQETLTRNCWLRAQRKGVAGETVEPAEVGDL